MKYTATQVAGMVDHTNLKAFASTEDIRKLCAEAERNGRHTGDDQLLRAAAEPGLRSAAADTGRNSAPLKAQA